MPADVKALESCGARVGEPLVKRLDDSLLGIAGAVPPHPVFLLALQHLCAVAPFHQENANKRRRAK
jgi:hypothetical protein